MDVIRLLILLCTILIITGILGCGKTEVTDFDYSARWRHSEMVVDDVTVVRTLNGSVWRGAATLVEELSIGEIAGDEPYLLGQVNGLAEGPDRIFILDEQIPALRMYDGSGKFIKDIGIFGSGPGEFRTPDGFTVHPVDGRLYLRDRGLSRVSIWSNTGEYLESIRVPRPPRSPSTFVILLNGDIYSYNRWQSGTMKYGIIGYNTEGAIGDTIPQPSFDYSRPYMRAERDGGNSWIPYPVPYTPEAHWALSCSGALISGLSSTYSFDVSRRDGDLIAIQRGGDLVPVLREESNWLRRATVLYLSAYEEGWTWDGGPIPETKPAFEQLQPDLSGRIWVFRQGPGERIPDSPDEPTDQFALYRTPAWRDTRIVEVFEESGRFLGKIQLPPELRVIMYIKDATIMGVATGTEGIQVVKKYRLVLP